MKMLEKDQEKEVPLPSKNTQCSLGDLFKNNMDGEMAKVKNIKCV